MFTFSAMAVFIGAKRPPPRLPIIVARVWPPRKRDFLTCACTGQA